MTQTLRDPHPPLRASCAAVACCAALLAACSGNVVTLGEGGEQRQPPPAYSRCLGSPTLDLLNSPLPGPLVVERQEQLDELEGCETITGSLQVLPLFQPDLRPLYALAMVDGTLSFDAYPLPEEQTQEQTAAMFQLLEDGWVPSLEGLEGLYRVGNLVLSSVAATDLTPLSHLRVLTAGGLVLRGTQARDLSALRALHGIRSLEVSGPQLESILDLQLPASMTSLDISGARLENADSLQIVADVEGEVRVTGTALLDSSALSGLHIVGGALRIDYNPALRSLDGLQELYVQGAVFLDGNLALENMNGLRGLGRAAALEVVGNDALERMPALFASGLQSIKIEANAALREIAGFPGLLDSFSPVRANPLTRALTTPEGLLAARPELFQVVDNPVLEQLAIPGGWQSIEQAVVRNNASLRALDIGTLEAIDLLSIANNPALAQIDLGELVSVDLLSVVDNPQLPAATFDTVKTFERQMSGNAGQ